jgi:hypothetical protein
MQSGFRFYFIFLFTLLQGLAPFIHAHAGLPIEYEGLHLPELGQVVGYPGQHGFESTEHQLTTLVVTDSLKHSDYDLGRHQPTLSNMRVNLEEAGVLVSPEPRFDEPVPYRTAYLIPYPCAPPRA